MAFHKGRRHLSQPEGEGKGRKHRIGVSDLVFFFFFLNKMGAEKFSSDEVLPYDHKKYS